MIRKTDSYPIRKVEHMLGGDGEFVIEDILMINELHDKGRLFARGTLLPGHSVGYHVHEKDMEICYFLSGTGLVEDENGVETIVAPGDANIVDVGHGHKITNTGKEPLVYLAVVIYA